MAVSARSAPRTAGRVRPRGKVDQTRGGYLAADEPGGTTDRPLGKPAGERFGADHRRFDRDPLDLPQWEPGYPPRWGRYSRNPLPGRGLSGLSRSEGRQSGPREIRPRQPCDLVEPHERHRVWKTGAERLDLLPRILPGDPGSAVPTLCFRPLRPGIDRYGLRFLSGGHICEPVHSLFVDARQTHGLFGQGDRMQRRYALPKHLRRPGDPKQPHR